MSSVIYSGNRSERATATGFLEKRIAINHAYASADFDGWLMQRLKVQSGEDILDVGCGSGAQTIPFADRVGPTGSVSSLDISADSVALLKSRLPAGARVQAVAADMAELAGLIANQFTVKRYTLAHSSYALYYSSKRLQVLDAMRGALKPGGRCAVFTPNIPHGLVDLAARFTAVPAAVNESLRFGKEVLEPYFSRNFPRFEVHHFHNVITLPSADILLEFYRQTTYYDAGIEPEVCAVADAEIKRTGSFKYEKNGYLIIGFVDG
jgi:ubiquinone/menaquinone biosynthesis C-methylase UbiE